MILIGTIAYIVMGEYQKPQKGVLINNSTIIVTVPAANNSITEPSTVEQDNTSPTDLQNGKGHFVSDIDNDSDKSTQVSEAVTEPENDILIGIAAGGNLIYMNQDELDKYFSDLEELGVKYVRFDADWSAIQPTSSERYDWEATDRVVKTADEFGVNTLLIITYTPAWAQEESTRKANTFPEDPAIFAKFAGEVAARYSSSVKYYEIWNEPNLAESGTAKDYAEILKLSSTEIRKSDPDAVILTGGLAPNEKGFVSFIEALYQEGAQNSFDIICLHPYTYPGSPESRYSWNSWLQISSVRKVMEKNGDSGKKTWITEFGAPTGGPGVEQEIGECVFTYGRDYMSEKAQVEIASQAIEFCKANDYIGGFFFYNLQDKDSTETSENCFGLLRADGSKKPAYTIIKAST